MAPDQIAETALLMVSRWQRGRVIKMTEPLKSNFKTIAEAEGYSTIERFEKVFDDNLSWISHDGLINAELIKGDDCCIVEYFG